MTRNCYTSLFAAALLALAGHAGAQDPPGVIVARASVMDFPLTVEALGTARANESIDVRPQVSETVTAIHFTEGAQVEAGEVLIELENTEALADVAAAKAELADSQSQYGRAQELYKTKSVSASEMEQLVARRDADRAALDAAESRLGDTVIRAPFAGRVGLRRISLGSLVSSNTIITTLDDTQTIKLDFDVPETYLARLAEGLLVTAESAAWPQVLFRGRIAAVDTRVDPISRTIQVRALIPNDEGLLRPGMFLTVTVLKENISALMIPEQAVVPERSEQFVFVVDSNGLVERRNVQTGRRRPGQVEILSGLDTGEEVIVEGTQKARPGEAVTIVERIDVGA